MTTYERTLFDTRYEPGDPRRLARRGDPSESVAAAHEIQAELPDLYRWVLQVVSESPGRTCSELSHMHQQRDVRRIGRRLPELVERGLLRRGKSRRCTVTNRPATTWWPASLDVEWRNT